MRTPRVIGWIRTAFLSVGVALVVSAGLANAQTSTGSIRGFVTGAGGAPVADAQIQARYIETNSQRGAVSSAAGFYHLGGLRPGRYDVTARRIGLAPQTRAVQVSVGQTLDVNFQLGVTAQVLDVVEVVAAAAAETRTSEVATNITREQIENLPLRDRNFLDLAQLAPGVRSDLIGSGRKTFASGAQTAEAVNVFIDGASYKNDVLLGGVAGQDASEGNPFPQDAVREFRIITQNYKAEYQKASSAIITATTRSGTNLWDGSVFAYGINKGFVARDAIAKQRNRPDPNFKRYQFGGSFGGPIALDRLFFFGTYEGNLRDRPADVTLGPDSLLAPPGLNPQQYVGRFTQEFREHLTFGKLTWTPSERSTVDVSTTWRHETDIKGFGGQTAYTAAENVRQDIITGLGNWRYARDSWLNEAQISAQRYRWDPGALSDDNVHNYFGIIRFGAKDTEQRFTQDRLSLRNDLTRSGVQWLGDHVFKAGASVDFMRYEGVKALFGNPLFEYRVDEQYLRPFQVLYGFGDSSIDTDNTQFGVYLQDDLTVTPQVVLNLGVRWDVETNMSNNDYVTPTALRDSLAGPLASQFFVDNARTGERVRVLDQLGGLDRYVTSGRDDRPAFKRAFQPRLGASFDLRGDGRTVLFGGWGIYYDRNFWNITYDEQYRRQFKVLRTEFNDVGPTPSCPRCVMWDPRYFNRAELQAISASGQGGLPEVFLIKNDTKPPKAHQYSAGIRQAFGRSLVSVSYAGVRGYNGFAFVRVTPWGGAGPNYSTVFASTDEIESWYNALLLKIERPMTPDVRWGGGIAYTVGKAEQKGEYFFSLDDRYLRPINYPRLPAFGIFTGISGDQRHTVVANGIFRLPFETQLSTVINLGTGFPERGTDASRGFGPQNERPYFFRPPTRPFFGVGHVFATRNVDVRLQKDLTLRSGQNVAVQAELFNTLNSANYGCWNTFIPPTGQSNANFGKPDCAAEGRRLQIGLRYDFRPALPIGR